MLDVESTTSYTPYPPLPTPDIHTDLESKPFDQLLYFWCLLHDTQTYLW
jgi:hypothetical protein